MNFNIIICFISIILISVSQASEKSFNDKKWWKGNLHSHSLWSDGDAPPEKVAAWYFEHDYNFLVLSEHDVIANHEKWLPVINEGDYKMTKRILQELVQDFGESWLETRVNHDLNSQTEMSLKTINELRQQFESPDKFILIQGEEITDRYFNKALHINAINIEKTILPQHGKNDLDTLQNNINAVVKQGIDLNRPVLAIINHPNMGFSYTPELLSKIDGSGLIEIYNGYKDSFNNGDSDHPSVEEMWDTANTIRLGSLKKPLLFGIASDDSHNFYKFGIEKINPGRGWIMVDSKKLSYNDITNEIKLGNFYASTGVELKDIHNDMNSITISINNEPGINYKTIFIGSSKKKLHHLYQGKFDPKVQYNIGSFLKITEQNPAIYSFTGNELFVRAKVISSKPQDNPSSIGDMESAWTQPTISPNYLRTLP